MDSEDPWDMVRKEPGEKQRNRQLMRVGFSGGLEPESCVICLQADEAEGWAGVQLPEAAGDSEAQRTDLFFNPLEELSQPTRLGEWSRFLASHVRIKLLERIPDTRGISRITATAASGPTHPPH